MRILRLHRATGSLRRDRPTLRLDRAEAALAVAVIRKAVVRGLRRRWGPDLVEQLTDEAKGVDLVVDSS